MRLISKRKINSISALLIEKGVESALFVNSEPVLDSNIPYLSGFFGMLNGALLFDTGKGMKLFVTELDYDRALDQSSVDDVIKLEKGSKFKDILKKHLPDSRKSEKIGIVKNRLTVAMSEKLKISKSRLVDISEIMKLVRAVKEEPEISAIEKSAEICNEGVRFLQDFIKPGIPEKDVAARLESELHVKGSERTPFDIIVASGPRSSHVHPYPSSSSKKIGRGLGIVDFGAVYLGYVTDVTVPFIIGKPGKKQGRMIETVSSIYDDILNKIKDGQEIKSIYSVYERSLKAQGYVVKHSLGHGIGLETHESPVLSDSNGKLKVNMTFALEPGVYVKGAGGIRVENDILVKKSGAKVLTKSKLLRL